MPVVSSGGPAPTAAAPARAAAPPVRLNAQGLPVQGGAVAQLAAAAKAGSHQTGILDWAGAPLQKVLHYASQPVYSVGSLLSGHPGEALQHLGQLLPLTHIAEALPGGIGHEVKKFTTPNSDVLPSQSALLAPLLAHLPNGLRQAAGFIGDVAFDPLTYVLPGAGGLIDTVARDAGEAALRQAGARAARIAAGGPMDTSRVSALESAHVAENIARDQIRAARGPGAHLRVGIAGTKYTKEVGTIPSTAALSRGASKVGGRVMANPKMAEKVNRLADEFLAGGRERKSPEYRAAVQTKRFLNTQGQKMMGEINRFDQGFAKSVAALRKAGELGPDGKPWNKDTAYEQLAHHIEQPEKYVIPEALKPHAVWAKDYLKRLLDLERAAGIDYKALPDYLTHRMKDPSQVQKYMDFAGRKGGHVASTPFFVRSERYKSIEAIQKATADATDVAAGRATHVGEHLGLVPETHVANLLKARTKAHLDAMREHSTRMGMAERVGVKAPLPADVRNLEALRQSSEFAAGHLKQLQTPTDLKPYLGRVKSRLAQRQGAELGLRVASRKAPALAARERTRRILEERVTARSDAVKAARAATKAGEQPAIKETQAALRVARGATERARKAVVKADRAGDPLAIRQAHRELRAAQTAHTEARLAHARAKGTYAGTAPAVRVATRRADRAQRKYMRALSDQERVDIVRKRLRAQPGRHATPEEWKTIKEAHAAAGLHGLKGVYLPKEQIKILERMKHEMDRSMANPADAKPIMGLARKLTSHWKSLALISPGYHLRNAYGDAISGWWAGARNPMSYLLAGRIIKAQNDPEKLARIRFKIDGKMTSADKFFHGEAEAMGTHGQGQIASTEEFGSVREALDKRIGTWGPIKAPRAPGRGAGAEFSQRVGQMREDATRLGTYIDLRRQGKSMLDAAEATHLWHMDYGHVSDFIDSARKFWMPFITYTSKSVPRTAKVIATRPGYFSHHASLATALSSAAGMPAGPEGLPIGQRSSFGVPDPGGLLHKILGMPADQPILWNPERTTPYGVLNSLDPQNPQQTVLGNLPSPFLKTPVEALTGHRFYYAGNAPRRAVAPPLIGLLQRLGIPIPDAGPKMSAALGREVPGYSAVADQFARMLPLYSQAAGVNPEDPQRMRTSLASLLAGLPLQSYDRAALMERAQKYGG